MLDPTSPTWKHIEEWATARLAQYRLQNDAVALDDRQTAALRGQIASLKSLLSLARPKDAPADVPTESQGPVGY